MNKTSPPSQERDEAECSFANEWSNILTQTNSAVESFTDGKEIGVRPRRQLGAEKRQQQQQEMGEGVDSSKKKGVVLHSHTHHHYHHKLGMLCFYNNFWNCLTRVDTLKIKVSNVWKKFCVHFKGYSTTAPFQNKQRKLK